MPEPLVSIVLPTYNGSAFIRQSIESCLQQTYENIELIIINDCSTDNTLSIINAYARNAKVKIHTNVTNSKLPFSLNKGFELSTGKYFTWTSDDNYYGPTAIQEMVSILENNPSADLVYSDYTMIRENGEVIRYHKQYDVNLSFMKWEGAGACFLYKNKVHHELKGYDITAFLIEDYDFFVRAYLNYQFYYLEKPELYFYRLHGSSLTSKFQFYVQDLKKLMFEKRLSLLFSKFSKEDKIKMIRKLAVYHGVKNSNFRQMNRFLKQLYALSKIQFFITLLYIPAFILRNFLISLVNIPKTILALTKKDR